MVRIWASPPAGVSKYTHIKEVAGISLILVYVPSSFSPFSPSPPRILVLHYFFILNNTYIDVALLIPLLCSSNKSMCLEHLPGTILAAFLCVHVSLIVVKYT